MKCYLDEDTALWLRRFCHSFSPEVTEQHLRKICLEAIERDDTESYVDLKTIDKELLQPIGVMLASHGLNQIYREGFLQLAREMFHYAGLSAVEKLAEIVNPKTANIEGRYDSARGRAIKLHYEREAYLRQIAQARAQNRSSDD